MKCCIWIVLMLVMSAGCKRTGETPPSTSPMELHPVIQYTKVPHSLDIYKTYDNPTAGDKLYLDKWLDIEAAGDRVSKIDGAYCVTYHRNRPPTGTSSARPLGSAGRQIQSDISNSQQIPEPAIVFSMKDSAGLDKLGVNKSGIRDYAHIKGRCRGRKENSWLLDSLHRL